MYLIYNIVYTEFWPTPIRSLEEEEGELFGEGIL